MDFKLISMRHSDDSDILRSSPITLSTSPPLSFCLDPLLHLFALSQKLRKTSKTKTPQAGHMIWLLKQHTLKHTKTCWPTKTDEMWGTELVAWSRHVTFCPNLVSLGCKTLWHTLAIFDSSICSSPLNYHSPLVYEVAILQSFFRQMQFAVCKGLQHKTGTVKLKHHNLFSGCLQWLLKAVESPRTLRSVYPLCLASGNGLLKPNTTNNHPVANRACLSDI